MEEILRKYFNCKKPFKKNERLSINGENAYGKLVRLLQDIDNLIDINFGNKIDELDKLAKSDEKNMSNFT